MSSFDDEIKIIPTEVKKYREDKLKITNDFTKVTLPNIIFKALYNLATYTEFETNYAGFKLKRKMIDGYLPNTSDQRFSIEEKTVSLVNTPTFTTKGFQRKAHTKQRAYKKIVGEVMTDGKWLSYPPKNIDKRSDKEKFQKEKGVEKTVYELPDSGFFYDLYSDFKKRINRPELKKELVQNAGIPTIVDLILATGKEKIEEIYTIFWKKYNGKMKDLDVVKTTTGGGRKKTKKHNKKKIKKTTKQKRKRRSTKSRK